MGYMIYYRKQLTDGAYAYYNGKYIRVGDSVILNPSEQMLIDNGYESYIPEVVPKSEPLSSEILKAIQQLESDTIANLSDEQAIKVAAIYPTWTSLLGQSVAAGTRVWDNGYLWKVIQAHTFSTEWRPEVATSLFTKVQIQQEQGTIDNPIEYSINMELIQGKYYVENGILYLCIRPLSQSVWALSALVGNYVEVVNS